MLKLEHISSGFGKKQVLFDVSFHIRSEEIVLLVGSNGSGKSTLLKTIYGLIPLWNFSVLDRNSQNKGANIFFDNENITDLLTSKMLKKGLIYIPQKDNLFEDLTVQENLDISGIVLRNSKISKERIEKVLRNFSTLIPIIKTRAEKLSGGERKLLTLAMALIHQPKMLLLDEPFAGLSANNITFMIKTIKWLNHNSRITFLIVEHRVREGLNLANRIIGLKFGKISVNESITGDFSIEKLREIYL